MLSNMQRLRSAIHCSAE